MDDLTGQILDNAYRVELKLGEGGMGAVFKGRDIALNRDVAIKVMHPNIARQEGFRDRFLQEARAIANLDHSGIVQVYAFSRNPDLLYIVMAFVTGQNLRDWMHLLSQKGLVVSLPESLALVEAVAEALAYAHRRGVFHRDIKPGNIILRPLEAGTLNEAGLSFQPVVTDFGLAKLAEGGLQSAAGMPMGTPAYMAPEQCEGRSVDGRADIYALGIVLYELVTGKVPFEVRTLTEALRAHTQEPPPPPRSLAPDLPSQVEEIILTALAKAPEQRYSSANEMARALRVARQALPKPEQATLAPTQAAGRASLVTMMAQVAPPPTPADKAWPTPPSEIPEGGRILILGPDDRSTAVPLGARDSWTIGRREGNDVVLPETMASRQHAQISRRGEKFYVTDLNSTNGTYMGSTRLLPGVAEEWRPGQALRIGDHWMRLEIVAAAAPAPSAPSGVGRAPTPPPRGEPLQAALEPAQLMVEAGSVAQLGVRILNRQQQVDHLSVVVEGLPATWIKQPENDLRLAPGDTGVVTLSIQPPREPTSSAGSHTFQVKVASRADPAHAAVASASLNVAPFHALSLEMRPTTLVNVGQAALRVRNRGNSAETVSLIGTDPSEALNLGITRPQFTLQAGEEQIINFPVATKAKRPWMGTPQTHTFSIVANMASGPAQSTTGALTVKPYLPTWAIPLLTTLVLLICAGAALAYNGRLQKQKEEKAQAALILTQQTATAEAQVALSLTQTAQAMSASEVQTATAAVGTATAVWLAADTDGDSLANAQELQWGTDPNNKDTDGDTLTDGQEVTLAISPISKDTDGDGIQDNVDPSPGQLPTPTPQPSETWTPTLTPEPSETPTFTPTALPTPKSFQQNQLNEYALTLMSVGTLSQVCLQHDNAGSSPDWHVAYVEVDSGSGYERYTFNRWIATDKGDGALSVCMAQPTPVPTAGPTVGLVFVTRVFRVGTPAPAVIKPAQPVFRITAQLVFPAGTPVPVSYKIRIQTSNVGGAGTTAKVGLRLVGSGGDSGWQSLE